MKTGKTILLMTLLVMIPLIATCNVKAAQTINLTSTETHHIIELNSNQPYVAGYHVDTNDLYTRERVNATAITVSFPSTEPRYFPVGSWLGAGMFVQAQDSRLNHVDYAFYTVLVLDASGQLFLDIGLHETRESTAPLQMPTEELIYAYTWQITGANPATPITLQAKWDLEGVVTYSLSTSGASFDVTSINVASLPDCESIISKFYAGNGIAGTAFPFGHYVYYFQFGIVSPKIIASNRWSAILKEPKILRKAGWQLVETAWSTQGDISYLDWDWMWGGSPYYGVSAQYYQNPLGSPYEVIFYYNGRTLHPGTVLWQHQTQTYTEPRSLPPMLSKQTFTARDAGLFLEFMVAIGVMAMATVLRRLKEKSTQREV